MSDFIEAKAVRSLLESLECDWGVAGGWAIDLFLDRISRKHQDIEVAIFRENQLVLQQYLLSRGWFLEYGHDGKMFPWPVGQHLALPIHEIWCRNPSWPLRDLEVLLNERDAAGFVFRRDSRIRVPIDRAFARSNSGIRILSPEIVLLYKARRAMDPQEQMDLSNSLKLLDAERRQWLVESVATTDPGHPWLSILSGFDSKAG